MKEKGEGGGTKVGKQKEKEVEMKLKEKEGMVEDEEKVIGVEENGKRRRKTIKE